MACKVNVNLIQKDIDDNLELLNIPTTKDVAGTAAMAWAMIDRIDKAMELAKNPQSMKLSKINRGGTIAAGLFAAYWAGAVIGSTARAVYRNTECTPSQVMTFAKDSGVSVGWLQTTYARYPELLNGDK
ncbi:hypothetical protein [Vibrio sp. D431a]|uniref:hypothetical protein n=1 Tax=Vibrio sp. D431a TaxID=2837388 RepID=UPI002554B59C|nr:hypothetical protein [Vibrio sp. D431a]MDK9789905.1 hypothetical protein [Vibrio sp. D431a]